MTIDDIISRQLSISEGAGVPFIDLPKYNTYTICNLRGGIGKTTITVNLTAFANDMLVVDACPQGNTSFFFDNTYYQNTSLSTYDLLIPYVFSGLGHAQKIAKNVNASNDNYDRGIFYIPSSESLYLFPSQLANALSQAITLPVNNRQKAIISILNSLKIEVHRESKETNTKKILIDSSPFFSGATHLAWHACDALIVPVRTDEQSIKSFELLLKIISDPQGEFQKNIAFAGGNNEVTTPKIQMVVLTHCGWSTRSGDQNVPNNATKIYLNKIRDIVARNITHFTTKNPDNHILILDDLLGSGRVSSAINTPIKNLSAGMSVTVNHSRVQVNESIGKCKNQLKFLYDCLW